MMTLDSKMSQKIEEERIALLKELLEERYGIPTRESDESAESSK